MLKMTPKSGYLPPFFVYAVFCAVLSLQGLAEEERGALPEADVERAKARAELMREAFVIEHVGSIAVAGEVVDQEGIALENIEMESRIMEPMRLDGSAAKHVVSQSIGPKFSVSATNCMQLMLTFRRDGYFAESMTLSVAKDGTRSWGGRKVVDKQDLRVVLTEMGEITQLTAYRARLEYHPSGEAKVADLTQSPAYHRLGLSDIRAEQSWPTNGLCVFAGEFPFGTDQVPRLGAHAEVVVQSVSLIMFGENDGFHVYHPATADRQRVFRAMQEAPEGGYQRSIKFPSEDRVVYFFCRVGRKFGKGYASIVGAMPKSGATLKVNTTVFLQADEGRNLNAESYAW